MRILPQTPLNHMRYQAILQNAVNWYEELAEKYGVEGDRLGSHLVDFASISTRITGLNGDLPFKPIEPGDDEKQMKKKFADYINTPTSVIADLLVKIQQTDKPFDPDLAPDVESDDPE